MPRCAIRGEHPDRGRLCLVPSPHPHPLAGPQRPREQADVRDPFARRRPLDLEDATRDRGLRVALAALEELVHGREEGVHPDAARRRTGVDRVERAGPGRRGQPAPQVQVREGGPLVADVRVQDRLIVLGEGLDECRAVGLRRHAEADDAGRQSSSHRRHDGVRVGPASIYLVDEDECRDVEALEGAEEERRLRLDTLDRRYDKHRAIEYAEDALHLGDEVGMAGGVDEVDRQVAHEERGDRRSDRDPAFPLEVERVGLGGAGVDAADVVDGAGGVEETFGEGGLTGVDVRQDAEVERAHGASCRARRW